MHFLNRHNHDVALNILTFYNKGFLAILKKKQVNSPTIELIQKYEMISA